MLHSSLAVAEIGPDVTLTHAHVRAQTAAREKKQLATYPGSQSQITLSVRWFIEAKVS